MSRPLHPLIVPMDDKFFTSNNTISEKIHDIIPK